MTVTWREGPLPARGSDLRGAFLVVAARPRMRSVNERVRRDAEGAGGGCSATSRTVPDLSNFILPRGASEGRSPSPFAGGASPGSRQADPRRRGRQMVSPEHAELALRLRAMRPEAKERFPSYAERRDFSEALVQDGRLHDGLPRRRGSRRSGAHHRPRARARSPLRTRSSTTRSSRTSSSPRRRTTALLLTRAGLDQGEVAQRIARGCSAATGSRRGTPEGRRPVRLRTRRGGGGRAGRSPGRASQPTFLLAE